MILILENFQPSIQKSYTHIIHIQYNIFDVPPYGVAFRKAAVNTDVVDETADVYMTGNCCMVLLKSKM